MKIQLILLYGPQARGPCISIIVVLILTCNIEGKVSLCSHTIPHCSHVIVGVNLVSSMVDARIVVVRLDHTLITHI